MKLSDTSASLLWQKKQNIIINYIEIKKEEKKKNMEKAFHGRKIGSKESPVYYLFEGIFIHICDFLLKK